MNEDNLIGIVEQGRFQPLNRNEMVEPARLTSIRMEEARSPESGELDLSGYEGKALMVKGHYSGDWIYSAAVLEQAGPLLTAVVQEVFDQRNNLVRGCGCRENLESTDRGMC